MCARQSERRLWVFRAHKNVCDFSVHSAGALHSMHCRHLSAEPGASSAFMLPAHALPGRGGVYGRGGVDVLYRVFQLQRLRLLCGATTDARLRLFGRLWAFILLCETYMGGRFDPRIVCFERLLRRIFLMMEILDNSLEYLVKSSCEYVLSNRTRREVLKICLNFVLH